LHPKGYGFLRSAENDYHQIPSDVFVAQTTIDGLGLRPGLLIQGVAVGMGPLQGPKLVEILSIDGTPPVDYKTVPQFEHLTVITPHEWLRLETGPQSLTTRLMDLL